MSRGVASMLLKAVWKAALCGVVSFLLFIIGLCALLAGAGWKDTVNHQESEFMRFVKGRQGTEGTK